MIQILILNTQTSKDDDRDTEDSAYKLYSLGEKHTEAETYFINKSVQSFNPSQFIVLFQ